MREIVTVALDNHILTELNRNLLDKDGVYRMLDANCESIKNLLVGYHYSEAGQVCNVKLKEDSLVVNISKGSGSFLVEYETLYFQACSGNRYDVNNKMIIEFEIVPYKSILELKGEEILERMPDSY